MKYGNERVVLGVENRVLKGLPRIEPETQLTEKMAKTAAEELQDACNALGDVKARASKVEAELNAKRAEVERNRKHREQIEEAVRWTEDNVMKELTAELKATQEWVHEAQAVVNEALRMVVNEALRMVVNEAQMKARRAMDEELKEAAEQK